MTVKLEVISYLFLLPINWSYLYLSNSSQKVKNKNKLLTNWNRALSISNKFEFEIFWK